MLREPVSVQRTHVLLITYLCHRPSLIHQVVCIWVGAGWDRLSGRGRLSGLVGTCIWVGAGWDLGSFHRASEHKADVREYFKAKIVVYTTPYKMLVVHRYEFNSIMILN